VADLLKLSLLSKTPLSDFVLKKKPILCNSNQNFEPKIKIGNGLPSPDSDEVEQMVVKVIRRTSNRKILFVTAEEVFADFLFSFLTFPMGIVLQMLEDDLVVTPMSSIDAISYLERMKVPLNDVEERDVSIGLKEGLSILKASLTSTSVLTDSLNQYIG
ncbi:DUF674 family protein, partial [Trifolium medium]|nr:DUF674 family protein [Trifolium medium]